MLTDLILGTAGHIDHGKTSLVKVLTGVDTDRLPEEKKRGITIELGFAELVLGEFRLGIVDMPGHERFVRNMLAGATGVDLALLVVAADDSVKPQTREHLEILRLLELRAGVIALTKIDLASPEWLDLVEEEVRELVSTTFLAGAPLIRTSSHTGEGIDALRKALAVEAEKVAPAARARRQGPFRMAIDRSFTVAGHGTVVTGSISSGQAKVGDTLVVEPGNRSVRIRGLENHDRQVEEVHRGQRAAINLAGIHHNEIGRGQELASEGHLVPSKLITVRLELLKSAPRPLKHRTRLRIHVGTAELMASAVVLDRDRLEPGEAAFAQLYLNEPAVTVWGQTFVVRSESPVVTIGGGKVIGPSAVRLRRPSPTQLAQLSDLLSPEDDLRAAAAIYFLGLRSWQPGDLVRLAGVWDGQAIVAKLIQQEALVEHPLKMGRRLLASRLALDEAFGRVEEALDKLHRADPLKPAIDATQLMDRLKHLGSPLDLVAVLGRMETEGRLKSTFRGFALPGRGPQLMPSEQRVLEQIIKIYRDAGFQPPSPPEVMSQISKNQAAVPQLLALAVSQGDLVQLEPDFYLHAEAELAVRERVGQHLREAKHLTVSQIREILGTSRKYALPICEYLDRIGFTRREGDMRVLANA